jgi:hypothetical protein
MQKRPCDHNLAQVKVSTEYFSTRKRMQHSLMHQFCYTAVVAEWLRRLTRNQIPSGSVGSSPTDCGLFIFLHFNNPSGFGAKFIYGELSHELRYIANFYYIFSHFLLQIFNCRAF